VSASRSLSGKSAVVTGGTGALGAAIVQAFLAEGARVAVPFRKAGELDVLRRRLDLEDETLLSGSMLDLTDETAVTAYADAVAEDRGGLDILINTAGAFAGGKPVHETPWSLWQEQLDSNLKTAVLASKAAVPHMLRRGGGAIVNVSSRPATESGENVSAYSAAKRAILQLTDAMAAELRDAGITVNAILPSTIDTPANRAAMPESDHGRWVKPEEIARVVLFLAGPDCRIVSGAHIPVYGKA
jgi:NAD(P)-dependent dehydrogenase (short-subunit alcohol dehydrogenase family)